MSGVPFWSRLRCSSLSVSTHCHGINPGRVEHKAANHRFCHIAGLGIGQITAVFSQDRGGIIADQLRGLPEGILARIMAGFDHGGQAAAGAIRPFRHHGGGINAGHGDGFIGHL